jgi:CheY-like chemotaxis protein
LRLSQVVTNLLLNAVKYTPEGGHIRLTLAREGQQAVLRLRDDGIGIRPEDLSQMFEFFTRGAGPQRDALTTNGLGVGLAFSRRLVELHGGRLEGHSDGPGKGSEFVVSIPISLQAEPPAHRAEPLATTEARSRPRRILVVDDNPDVADSLKVLLQSQGHDVRALHTAGAVVATVGEFCPEVVFLDISMPEIDGYQLAAAIREASPEARPFLVAMTGYGQDKDRKAAMEAGFDRYRLKPLPVGEIQTLLAELE